MIRSCYTLSKIKNAKNWFRLKEVINTKRTLANTSRDREMLLSIDWAVWESERERESLREDSVWIGGVEAQKTTKKRE